jgi:hypothetical protein
MPPVSFRSAKPVDPKSRHPFSGEVLDVEIDKAGPWGPEPGGPTSDSPGPPATPPESFRTVIADLKLRRAELDRAIDLLERLMP